MRRLAVDILLIVAPFGTLSLFFFLGGETPRYGVAFAIVALLSFLYVRPWQHFKGAASEPETGSTPPAGDSAAGVGNVGGPV
jgi:membrane protein implicated in regulation of membrane protease activity